MIRNNEITDQIEFFIKLLTTMTKEEADFIEEILRWDNDKKAAYLLAKQIFEDEDDSNE